MGIMEHTKSVSEDVTIIPCEKAPLFRYEILLVYDGSDWRFSGNTHDVLTLQRYGVRIAARARRVEALGTTAVTLAVETLDGSDSAELSASHFTEFHDCKIRVVSIMDDTVKPGFRTPTHRERKWEAARQQVDRVASAISPINTVLRSGLARELIKAVQLQFNVRYCETCIHFDKQQGQEAYTRVTHTGTMCGDRQMLKDITDCVATNLKRRTLETERVGLCLEHESLVQENYLGCDSWSTT